MRETLFILTLLFSGFFASANAQVTAVMQVRVNIVSGASLTSVEESVTDLSSADFSMMGEINAGSFSLTAAPDTDISVSVSQQPALQNEDGQMIEMDPLKVTRSISESGKQHISLNGTVKNKENLNGEYKGAVTAVIEYL